MVWIFLVIVFGLCGSSEAQRLSPEVSVEGRDEEGPSYGLMAVVDSDSLPGAELSCGERRVSGELDTSMVGWTHNHMGGSRKTAESQTEDMNIVPLPLASGLPCKARLLFSLWKAGCSVDAEPYSRTVQEEFHGLCWCTFEEA